MLNDSFYANSPTTKLFLSSNYYMYTEDKIIQGYDRNPLNQPLYSCEVQSQRAHLTNSVSCIRQSFFFSTILKIVIVEPSANILVHFGGVISPIIIIAVTRGICVAWWYALEVIHTKMIATGDVQIGARASRHLPIELSIHVPRALHINLRMHIYVEL